MWSWLTPGLLRLLGVSGCGGGVSRAPGPCTRPGEGDVAPTPPRQTQRRAGVGRFHGADLQLYGKQVVGCGVLSRWQNCKRWLVAELGGCEHTKPQAAQPEDAALQPQAARG